MACDIRITSENDVFSQPNIKIGVIPGAGGTQRLPRLIGLGKAKELLFTGDPIDAQEAYRIGFVNRIVPVGSLMEEAKKMALKLLRQPGFALKMIKTVVNEGSIWIFSPHWLMSHAVSKSFFSTGDQKEGMKAFHEKRPLIFKGK